MYFINRVLIRIDADGFYNRARAKLKRKYSKKAKPLDVVERQNLHDEYSWEEHILDEEWMESKSDRLLNLARRYDLVIPRDKEGGETKYWTELSNGMRVLNTVGRNTLKKEIREEQRWQRERRMNIAVIIFGIIGGLTGLLAVIIR